jgi:hypothetical protein
MGATKIRRGDLTLYPNYKLGAELRRTATYDAVLRQLTAEGALGAKEIAVRVAFDKGDYFSSIHGELGHNRKGLRVGLVVADDYKAHWVERGWQHHSHGQPTGVMIKGKNVLRRGGRRAGLRVRAPRKRG